MPMQSPGFEQLKGDKGLLQTMKERRSRRFLLGGELTEPLGFKSQKEPVPLTEEEEALLAFAASGITWYALADLPYENPKSTTTAGTTILAQLVGRTAPSGDALHSVVVFIMNDQATYVLRRPQDLCDEEVKQCIELVRKNEFVEAYRLLRIKVRDGRTTVSDQLPITLPFNNWASIQ